MRTITCEHCGGEVTVPDTLTPENVWAEVDRLERKLAEQDAAGVE